MKKISLIIFLLIGLSCHSQRILESSDSLQKWRKNAVVIGTGITYAASVVGLQFAWYQDYQNNKFRFFDDGNGWLQMDKIGHSATAYQAGKSLFDIYRWAGIKRKPALLWSASASYSFQLTVEIMDGFSDGWGFSLYDLGFNSFGTGFFVGQELVWKEQRIEIKYSFTPSGLTNLDGFEGRRARNLYGNSILEQWLKDYNGQTYWLSANIWSLVGKPEKFPKWVNLALGYSANNMLGAESNSWTDPDDASSTLTSNKIRERQFLLSMDVDLNKMQLPKYLNWLKLYFSVVKIPFPALELNSEKGLRAHPFYF